MAKLYKIEMYVLDVNEDYDKLDSIISRAECRTGVNFNCFNTQETQFEWNDDIDLNHDCGIEAFRKYFK